MTGTNRERLFQASGLSKSFPGVKALSDVSFDLARGEVHALVGENGAGKSTLVRIIAGVARPDAGTMRYKSRPFTPASRLDAERGGVRIVMQELNLIATLTVAESIFFGRMPSRFGLIRRQRMNRAAREALSRVGLGDVAPDRLVRSLGVGQQQLVEIAVGLSRRCDLLLLDEPTAALADKEVDLLFGQIARLKSAGVGIIYISHRMEDIQRIADRVTVLRDGELIGTFDSGAVTMKRIVQLMVGRELGEFYSRPDRRTGTVTLRVEGLCRRSAVSDVSFELRSGEILGFAGLMGSGRTETVRAIFGADRPDAGRIFLYGSDKPAKIRRPRDAVCLGMALLTEDRKEQGLLLALPVHVNVTLTRLRALSRAGGWIRFDEEQAVTERLVKALAVRCHSLRQKAGELSGGNQQKLVMAKWLYRDCNILIFDEPTRGIDVGAKFEIYKLLADLAARGKAIIVVSSELKELMALCDRIAVMSAGRLVRTFRRNEWSQEKLMAAALSGYGASSPKMDAR